LTETVIVETNWVIDVALGRDTGSETLWRLANTGEALLLLPSLCLAEAVKVLESQQRTWNRVFAELERQANDIRRASAFVEASEQIDHMMLMLASLGDLLEKEFWPKLNEISRRAQLLELSHETIALATDIREFIKLAPADSAVLATAVLARRADMSNLFMSRNKNDFGKEHVLDYLNGEGLEYHPNPGALAARLLAS
jgi:predicted nucleic acid-binding protein